MRVKITLRCNECKQRNYNTFKNKKNDPDRLEMKKYCPFCRKHTIHKEACSQKDRQEGREEEKRRLRSMAARYERRNEKNRMADEAGNDQKHGYCDWHVPVRGCVPVGV